RGGWQLEGTCRRAVDRHVDLAGVAAGRDGDDVVARGAVDDQVGGVHALDGADVHRGGEDAGGAALVGGDAGGGQGVAARVEGGAAGQQGHGLRGAAVVARLIQEGVAGDRTGQAAAAVLDQVVAAADCGGGRDGDVPARAGGHDRVVDRQRACLGAD